MHYAYRPNSIEQINFQHTVRAGKAMLKLRVQLRILLRAWDAGKLNEANLSDWLKVFYPE